MVFRLWRSFTPVIGYGLYHYGIVADDADEILRNVSIGDIEMISDDLVDSNL
jgi:hypothetical protein